MRSNYPVSSKESWVELMSIQEQLLYLLGYDPLPYDGEINASGIFDKQENEIDEAIKFIMWNRIYKDKNT